jgi:hypothetical protein
MSSGPIQREVSLSACEDACPGPEFMRFKKLKSYDLFRKEVP